ncbi:MAG: NADPH-dependent glutamate synthase [Bacteroidetes bacterium]|jgi:glutamate synthase (NADPH/NADH) small chain|nr:NADPH-dependent glutamate synthase [Bacteroidota bacterium]
MMNDPRNEPWREALRKSMKARERTLLERTAMNEVPAQTRRTNYDEVNTGYTAEMAVQESQRCLDCKNPTCMEGCPVNIDIPTFVKQIEARNFAEAAKTIKQTNIFPAICGRVCPQEAQCESTCFYTAKLNKPSVAIGNLERFTADYEQQSGHVHIPEIKTVNDIKVAVIGSGPAGLAAASDLAMNGYKVTIFEALHEFGGVLKYGIPEFRLPNSIIEQEISVLKEMGVTFIKNFIVGKTATIDDLKEEGFEAFFVGSGAGLPRFMNIPGENLIGVLSANEYLTRVNLMGAHKPGHDTPVLYGKKVAVIGGGNTAMDSVRTALRLGAEKAMIIYRRSFDEMPARKEEIQHAKDEGVEFLNLTNPVEYKSDDKGRVNKVILQKMELSEKDASGRRRPVPIENSEYEMDIDLAVVCVGVSPNPIIPQSITNLELTKWDTIQVDPEQFNSNIPGLFAGGDIVRGGATVILAMGDGRKASAAMHQYLQKQLVTTDN